MAASAREIILFNPNITPKNKFFIQKKGPGSADPFLLLFILPVGPQIDDHQQSQHLSLIHIYTDEEFDQIFSGGVADYAKKLKEEGVIRALGISTHDPAIGLRAIETGLMDVILFSINPAYDLSLIHI